MYKYLVCFFLFINEFSFSQEALQYSNFFSADSIRGYLFTLASDSLEGRETGRPGQKKAALFLESKYKSWGLLPGADSLVAENNSVVDAGKMYLQDHPISIRNNKSRNLCLNGEYFLFGRDFFYDNILSDKSMTIDNGVVIGLVDDSEKNEIKKPEKYSGKNLVFFNDAADQDRYEKFLLSSGIKPASVFIITDDKTPPLLFSLQKTKRTTLNCPVFFISESVARVMLLPDVFNSMKKKITGSNKIILKKIKCDLSLDVVNHSGFLRGENVLAFIPGSDLKNETVVISSHYDHLGIKDSSVYYGADDNASGTSAVLEIARIFERAKKEGNGPRRNMLFLNVSGEEKGLLGSAWYVAHPAFPLESTIADLNIDMIGRTDPYHDSTKVKDYVYIIGSDKMSTELHEINENENKSGPKLELDYKFNSPDDPNHYYKRSDHYNFVKKGIPVIFYFDGNHKDYHKPTDTADKIDFDQLVKRAQLVFLTGWELANRNKRVAVDKVNDLDK